MSKISADSISSRSGQAITVNNSLNVSGVVTATSFSGGGLGVGIRTSGVLVGTGATILDLRGAGISTVTVSSGIATINITGGGGGSGALSGASGYILSL